LDINGLATIKMPDYFESINTNFSYQLTPVGASFQPYIAQELKNGVFVIGGNPNGKVSWMVLAERNDPYYIKMPHKKEVEMIKPDGRKGKYLMPQLYGQPEELGMFYKEPKEHQKSGGLAENPAKDYESKSKKVEEIYLKEE
jgi:hypothetical protein